MELYISRNGAKISKVKESFRVKSDEQADEDGQEDQADRFRRHVDVRMMEHLLFFRIVGAQCVDGHLDAVDDWFGQAD